MQLDELFKYVAEVPQREAWLSSALESQPWSYTPWQLVSFKQASFANFIDEKVP